MDPVVYYKATVATAQADQLGRFPQTFQHKIYSVVAHWCEHQQMDGHDSSAITIKKVTEEMAE